jgi:serine protease Do
VIDAQGLVVTNYHVVRGADSVSIVSQEGTTHQATVIGHDALTDFALLQVPNLRLPAIAWGDSDLVETGHFVWAIGCPFGLDQSVSMGIVSSTNRPTILDSPFQDFLQTDASINPGNSGGALVDAEGRLIGINTAITGDSFQGISFALPSNTARQVTEQLKSAGQIPRGWIGMQLGAVTPSRAAMAGLENPMGAYVESIVNGDSSPASAAGMQVGDICTEFNGQSVFGPLGLLRQIAKQPIGTTAKVTVIRGGMTLELEVAVSERPRS